MCCNKIVFVLDNTHTVSVELKFDQFGQRPLRTINHEIPPPDVRQAAAAKSWRQNCELQLALDISQLTENDRNIFSLPQLRKGVADRTEIRPAKSDRHCLLKLGARSATQRESTILVLSCKLVFGWHQFFAPSHSLGGSTNLSSDSLKTIFGELIFCAF